MTDRSAQVKKSLMLITNSIAEGAATDELHEWKFGTRIIQQALSKARLARHEDAPMGLTEDEAEVWHKGHVEAYEDAILIGGHVPDQTMENWISRSKRLEKTFEFAKDPNSNHSSTSNLSPEHKVLWMDAYRSAIQHACEMISNTDGKAYLTESKI